MGKTSLIRATLMLAAIGSLQLHVSDHLMAAELSGFGADVRAPVIKVVASEAASQLCRSA